jgi:hypothetical protein
MAFSKSANVASGISQQKRLLNVKLLMEKGTVKLNGMHFISNANQDTFLFAIAVLNLDPPADANDLRLTSFQTLYQNIIAQNICHYLSMALWLTIKAMVYNLDLMPVEFLLC